MGCIYNISSAFKAFAGHLDLSCMCVIHCPAWDLAVIYFQVQMSAPLVCCLGSDPQRAAWRAAPHIDMLLFGILHALSSLTISDPLRPSFAVVSQKSRTSAPLLCCVFCCDSPEPSSGSQERKRSSRDSPPCSWNYTSEMGSFLLEF